LDCIVLGLIAGFIASKVVNKSGEGMLSATAIEPDAIATVRANDRRGPAEFDSAIFEIRVSESV
jgi:hypothetical protein